MSIIDALEATLAGGTDNVQLRFGLASAYFRDGRFAEAAEHAQVAVELDPDYSAAWRLLGRCMIAIGDTGAAIQTLEQGLAVAEKNGDMQLVREISVFLKRLRRDEAE